MENSFIKRFFVLFSGSIVGQALTVIFMPIFTRLYTPSDFGVFSFFMSLVFIMGIAINARYELAIYLPPSLRESVSLAYLSFLINFVLSLLLLFFVLIFAQDRVFYLLPISIFLMGLSEVLISLCIKVGKSNYLGIADIKRALIMVIVTTLLGFLNWGYWGLILGRIIGQFTYVLFIFLKLKFLIKKYTPTLNELKLLAYRYRNFPKFSIFEGILDNVNNYIVVVFMKYMYSNSIAGYYGLASRLLMLPILFISRILQRLMVKEIVEREGSEKIKFLSFITFTILILSAFIYCLLSMISTKLTIIFGERWLLAFLMLKYLSFLFFGRFIYVSLSSILISLEKQKIGFIQNMLLTLLYFAVFLLVYLRNYEVLKFIKYLTLVIGSLYLFQSFLIFYLFLKHMSNSKRVS